MVEVGTVGEIKDIISPEGDLNLILNQFVIIVASQLTRNLIVNIIRDIRRLEKLSQINYNTRRKIKVLLP